MYLPLSFIISLFSNNEAVIIICCVSPSLTLSILSSSSKISLSTGMLSNKNVYQHFCQVGVVLTYTRTVCYIWVIYLKIWIFTGILSIYIIICYIQALATCASLCRYVFMALFYGQFVLVLFVSLCICILSLYFDIYEVKQEHAVHRTEVIDKTDTQKNILKT